MKPSNQFICSKLFNDLVVKFPNECIKRCCKSEDVNHIDIKEITTDYFLSNEQLLKDQNSMLVENKLPAPTCNTCIHSEPYSLFRSWNRFPRVSKKQKDKLYGGDNLISFEFVLSSACDLKCVYCSPKDSTAWAKERGVENVQASKEWKDHTKKTILEYFEQREWDKSQINLFKFSGGEPTYNLEMIEFIEDIMSKVPNDVRKFVMINTNLNTKKIILERFLTYVQANPNIKFGVAGSLDSLGEKCEAIRYGVNWNRAIDNIKRYFDFDNVIVYICPTVNLMSVPDMFEFVKFFDKLFKSYNKPLRFNENVVAEPWLSPNSMLPEHAKYLGRAIKYSHANGYTNFGHHLRNIQKLIGSEYTDDTKAQVKEHLEYLEEKRPNTPWRKLFPHIEDIIEVDKTI